jgi:hypothetical protein
MPQHYGKGKLNAGLLKFLKEKKAKKEKKEKKMKNGNGKNRVALPPKKKAPKM